MGAIPTIIDIILLYSQVDKAPVKKFLVFCEVFIWGYGGIGRRTALKMLRAIVWVRLPLSPLIYERHKQQIILSII